ncbi:site-specific integrase [Vibrio ulleungensis]|uniref:Site-specific integrase n=1 Tax=Vibrio ulleungensis TaxID=2807619 RepID=A0ABS2HIR5_9VIBR|nr:site-specific integrase [Vibrio ulleungensis]MBM7037423.1 site-specific integrase [Vibrio ulleungensis]
MPIKKKITNSALKDLTVEQRRINDTEVSGFHALKFASGKIAYYVYYRIDGKQVNFKIGLASDISPAQARDRAREKLGEVVKGTDVQESRKQARIEQKSEKYLNFYKFLDTKYSVFLKSRNPKTAHTIISHLKSMFKCFKAKNLNEIDAWSVEQWRNDRLELGRKPSTINASVNTLKGAMSRAVEWGIIDSHELHKVKTLKFDNTRIRYLSTEELAQLNEAILERNQLLRDKRDSANEHRRIRGRDEHTDLKKVRFVDYLEPLIILAMNTGLRRGELLSLKWSDITTRGRYLTVRASNAKSSKSRVVHLNDTALSALRYWKKQNTKCEFVFTADMENPLADIKKAWNNLLAKSGVTDFRFHDFRHHFASSLVMAGVDLNTVRELLGHSDLKMTLRYAHLAPEHKAAAVNLIG